MKNTGIVRRIDELGRIVIPKEIRKTLRLHVGTQMEIYTTEENALVLKKHSAISEIKNYADVFCVSLANSFEEGVLVCDLDKVISVSNASKKEYLGKSIASSFEKLLLSKKSYILNKSEKSVMESILPNDSEEYYSQIIVPVISQSDVVGGVVLFSKKENKEFLNTDAKTLQAVANIFSEMLG